MALDPIITTIGSADNLKTAGGKINANKDYLDGLIETEISNRIASVDTCVNLSETNFIINKPIMFGDINTVATQVITPDFNSGSPNFYLTYDVAQITINNPTGLFSGQNQSGFIITKTKDIVWGSKYSFVDSTNEVTFTYLWLTYFVLDVDNIIVAVVEEITT